MRFRDVLFVCDREIERVRVRVRNHVPYIPACHTVGTWPHIITLLCMVGTIATNLCSFQMLFCLSFSSPLALRVSESPSFFPNSFCFIFLSSLSFVMANSY